MSALHADLALVWYLLLAFILLLALLLDGFSLGVGILSLFVGPGAERGRMMASVAQVWHANQTWLVVLGAVLFGAFPLVYGLVLSAFYIPMALMLLGFIFRGVSLEYYGHTAHKGIWGLCYGLGSLLAAAAQGFMLGSLLGGLPLAGQRFAGGPWTWLSPFSLLCLLCVLGAYSLCGAGWLLMKTGDALREKALRAARACAYFLLLGLPALIGWAWGLHPALSTRWLTWPGLLYSSLPLALAVLTFAGLAVCLSQKRGGACFGLSLLLVLLFVVGLAGSWFPMLVPPDLSLYQAASQTIHLKLMLVGIGIFLPLMLIYNAYQYWVFRGKPEQEA
jgi:cytochrome d ubiquinol oxidase subunit II